jgi:hypothetical protein
VRAVLLATLTAIVLLVTAPAGRSACGGQAPNPIVAENCLSGTPQTTWDISGSGDAIDGFTTDISVDRGGTVQFKIDTTAPSYRLDIYRMGYYGGDGARRVDTVTPTDVRHQEDCDGPDSSGLVDCTNWVPSASWAVPGNAVSGIYFAAAVRPDNSVASHIFFIVRDDASRSDLYYQTSDTTWQAYNRYGMGNSLYTGGPLHNPDRAAKVSYNRPFTTRTYTPEDCVFNAEYPMVRWLERNGYDVSYETGVDTDRFGSLIRNHKVFVSSGHDEYWSGQQRANVEAARDAGVNLAFFSGNEIFWKTRWENNHRTLVSYKETHANAKIDPTSAWTGTWMDPRFNSENRTPQNALSGTLFTVTDGTRAMEVPSDYRALRFWRNTRVANLAAGQTATLGDDTIGYEWDSDIDNGVRPAGLFDLSSTTFGALVLTDYGSRYESREATHNMTMYRARSGALVFGAGTVQWAWGLDSRHDRGSAPPDAAMQQATVNLLADMHAQPATPQSGLVPATASTDTIAPQSSITSPAPGTPVVAGQQVTIVGTADDAGGGHVAGVEVSVDGGATWHPAVGRENWVYVWTPTASGTPTLLSRAVDDSGNLGPRVPDTTPPSIASVAPGDGATGVDPGTDVTARFDEALDPSTVSAATFALRNAAGAAVAADVSYDAATRTAVLRPHAPLAWSASYSAIVKGGAITDASGNALAADRAWTFTTAARPGSAGTPAAGAAGSSAAANAAAGPRVGVSPRTIRASKTGVVKLRVACPRGTGGCRVALRLELGRRAVAKKTVTVRAGASRTVALTLSRAARRDLLRRHSLRVTAVAVATDRGGKRATTRTSVLLLAPRKP